MVINSQGFEHFLQHVNNQDFFYETPRMLLVLDGCSGGKYSEVGTRLFTQLFSRREENDSVEKFESNVKEVFDEIIEIMRKYYPDQESLENDFIMENLLFTIIACFDCKDKFIVKMFGDGYIITQNNRDRLSYMKFSYGKCPPYFAYKYCKMLTPNIYKDYEFKTFEFDKKIFKSVGIASDGILPIVKSSDHGMDFYILKKDNVGLQMAVRMKNQLFSDDVTIAFFENRYSIPYDSNPYEKQNVTERIFVDEITESLAELDKAMGEEKDMKDLETILFGERIVKKPVELPKASASDKESVNESAEKLNDKSAGMPRYKSFEEPDDKPVGMPRTKSFREPDSRPVGMPKFKSFDEQYGKPHDVLEQQSIDDFTKAPNKIVSNQTTSSVKNGEVVKKSSHEDKNNSSK